MERDHGACYAPGVIRARTARRVPRPFSPMAFLVVALAVAGCSGNTTPSNGPQSLAPTSTATQSAGPSESSTPVATPEATAGPTPEPTQSPGGEATPAPSGAVVACSGSDANRAFFAQAASAMTWSVYCAVVPTGWYLESGTYRLANGGRLEVTYRGPGDAHLAMAEGNVCDGLGTDIEVCAPRDTVIGPAAMGDLTGGLGRLANGLVLDVDRGANPSWRITGLGVSEAEFVALSAAMLRINAGN